MRGIAKLLFGDALAGRGGAGRGEGQDHDGHGATADADPFGPGDGWGLAERARRAGEWCGSTPGGDAITRAPGEAGRRSWL